MIACAVGKGKSRDAGLAARQAAEICMRQLDGDPELLLVFASRTFESSHLLSELRSLFPHCPLAGCSTAGEIYSDGPDEESLAVIALGQVKATTALGGFIGSDGYAAGRELGQQLQGAEAQLVPLLSDGLVGDGAAVIRGVRESLLPQVPIFGGAAGDDSRFQRTEIFMGAERHSGRAAAVGLSGDFVFGLGVRHGWEPVGLPVRVTKSHGNRLLEMNGVPAIRLYQEYFGEYTERMRTQPLARLAICYPLGLPVQSSSEYLLRAPLSVEQDGSIRLTAEIPEGAHVRLMIGSVDSALKAARIATLEALSQMKGRPPRIAVVFSGMARRSLFGPKSREEIQLIQNILGPSVPVAGFYGYGEFAPLEGTDACAACFHNETMAILLLG
ncbi:MAG: FIST N-terminal domain-containing protein [candidate division FCPU426 bacterium]